VYVHTLLEYNSVIWSTHLKCDIEAIERVQRRFNSLNVFLVITSTDIVSDYGYYSYPDSKLDVYKMI